jgi:hypothetical protein
MIFFLGYWSSRKANLVSASESERFISRDSGIIFSKESATAIHILQTRRRASILFWDTLVRSWAAHFFSRNPNASPMPHNLQFSFFRFGVDHRIAVGYPPKAYAGERQCFPPLVSLGLYR